MGLIEKIKLLFKAQKPVGEFITQVKGARLKYKTIPFWVTLLGTGISLVGAVQGVIPATTAVVVSSLLTAAYNILRGADKMNQEGVKPPFRSTEFWLGALGIVGASLTEIQTAGVQSNVLTSCLALIAGAMAAAQNLGAQQPKKEDPK